MVQGRVRQHGAEVRVAGSTGISDFGFRISDLPKEDNWRFGRAQQSLFQRRDFTFGLNAFERWQHEREGFISDFGFRICRRRTIGDSGERSSRSSNGETSHSALTLSSDGNMSAKGLFRISDFGFAEGGQLAIRASAAV